MTQYYKLLNADKKCNDTQFQDGLNVYKGIFNLVTPSGDGIYFINKAGLPTVIHPTHHWVYEVIVPEHASSRITGNGGKADQIIIKNPKKLCDFLRDNYNILGMLKKSGELIRYVENPTEEMCYTAIKQNGSNIQYVVGPTNEILDYMAFSNNPENIKYIKSPTEALCMIILYEDPKLFHLIRNPSRKVCLEAVKKRGLNLEFVADQDEEICFEAVKNDCMVFKFVKERTTKIDEATLNGFLKKA